MDRPMVVIDLEQEPRLVRDLTAGGVYVNGCALAINSECSLVVRGPTDELCLTARVVYVDGDRGAGLELVGFGAAMRAQLSALVGAPSATGSGQTAVPAIPDEPPAIPRTMSDEVPAIPRTMSPRGAEPPRTRTPVRAADDDGHVARTRTPPGGTDRSALVEQLDFARTQTARTDDGVDPPHTHTERASQPNIAISRTRTPLDEPDTPADPEPPIAIARTRARSSEQPPAPSGTTGGPVFRPTPPGSLYGGRRSAPPAPSGWLDDALANLDQPHAAPAWTGDELELAPVDAQPHAHEEAPRPDSTERIPLEELLADEPADAPFELELELLPPAEQCVVGRVITDEVQTMDDEPATPAAEPLVAAEIDPAELGGEGDEKKRLALNHYERLRGLTLAAAIKKATSVDPGERMILERLYGKSVWEPLLRNPRLTPPEVSRIARMGALPRPLLELITSNGAWLQVAEVRRALLSNPRLGTDQILRVLRLMPKHELKLVASQTVYPHPVRDAAKRLIKETEERGGR